LFKKKSIVLSDVESNSNKKAVMTLEESNDGLKGNLRLYNFPHELDGVSSLGINANQKVYKAGLTLKSNRFYEFFVDLKDIPNVFSCALINFQNAVPKPVLYGSSSGGPDDVYAQIITEISDDRSYQNAKSTIDKFDSDLEKKNEIEKEIDHALCTECDACANCVYKKYFFENHKEEVSKQDIVLNEQEIPAQQEQSSYMFLDRLKPQIDKMFEENPTETMLQNLIPSSKWVKVEYEDDGDFYVFGLLYDDEDNIKYVCYGVPAVFEEDPPKELSGYPIWFPLDKENSKGFGYWLTYQDASTGEPVKAIME